MLVHEEMIERPSVSAGILTGHTSLALYEKPSERFVTGHLVTRKHVRVTRNKLLKDTLSVVRRFDHLDELIVRLKGEVFQTWTLSIIGPAGQAVTTIPEDDSALLAERRMAPDPRPMGGGWWRIGSTTSNPDMARAGVARSRRIWHKHNRDKTSRAREEQLLAMTECTQASFAFASDTQRTVVAKFDGGTITTEGGGLLLHQVEQKAGILRQFAACFRDFRDPTRIDHTVEELVRQRVYALARLRRSQRSRPTRADPLLAMLSARPSGRARRRRQRDRAGGRRRARPGSNGADTGRRRRGVAF